MIINTVLLKDLPFQSPSHPVDKVYDTDTAMFFVANAKVSKVEKYFIAVLVDSFYMNRNLCERGRSECVMLVSLA